jgi:hypothetical protein
MEVLDLVKTVQNYEKKYRTSTKRNSFVGLHVLMKSKSGSF